MCLFIVDGSLLFGLAKKIYHFNRPEIQSNACAVSFHPFGIHSRIAMLHWMVL